MRIITLTVSETALEALQKQHRQIKSRIDVQMRQDRLNWDTITALVTEQVKTELAIEEMQLLAAEIRDILAS